MAVGDLLATLARANLKALHKERARAFNLLADECKAALNRQGGAHWREYNVQLHCMLVLDFCAENQFGAWIQDYVTEVCGDTQLTSNDALEAQLLDGSFVKDWCNSSLKELEKRVSRGGPVSHDLALTEVVISVLTALGEIRGRAGQASRTAMDIDSHAQQGSETSDVTNDIACALRLKRFQTLLQWAGAHGLSSWPPNGVYGAQSQWSQRLSQRNQACRDHGLGRSTFFNIVADALNDASKGALKLPSRVTSVWCIEEATEGAHTQGSTGDRDREARDVWECCLALVVYYLTDIGVLKCDMQQALPFLQSISSAFTLPMSRVSVWAAAPWLDEALAATSTDAGARAAQHAADLLLAHAPEQIHTSFLQMLGELGFADTALLLHRARERSGVLRPQDQEAAWTLIELRLKCGLVAEAMAASRSYASQIPDVSQRTEALSRLLKGVLDWCAAYMDSAAARTAVMEMCSGTEEESVLISWFLEKVNKGEQVGQLLPVVLAARGCVPEAMSAYQRLGNTQAAPNIGLTNSLDAIVDSAAGALPLSLRQVFIEKAPGQGDDPSKLASDPNLASAGILGGLNLSIEAHVQQMHTIAVQTAAGLLPPVLAATRTPQLPPAWYQPPPPKPAPAAAPAAPQPAFAQFALPVPGAAAGADIVPFGAVREGGVAPAAPPLFRFSDGMAATPVVYGNGNNAGGDQPVGRRLFGIA